MSNGRKGHREGGKIGGDHTTFIDLAGEMADVAERLPEVTKISGGFISGKSTGPSRRVKIGNYAGGVLLTVKQGHRAQEVRIITRDVQATKLAIARAARNMDVPICFGKNGEKED